MISFEEQGKQNGDGQNIQPEKVSKQILMMYRLTV